MELLEFMDRNNLTVCFMVFMVCFFWAATIANMYANRQKFKLEEMKFNEEKEEKEREREAFEKAMAKIREAEEERSEEGHISESQ